MSPILFEAPFYALILSAGVWLVIRFGCAGLDRKWSPASTFLATLAGCLVFPLATYFFFVTLPGATTHAGMGVSPHEANDHLMAFQVPEAASDVNYRHERYSGRIDEVSFTMPRKEFLEWMKAKGRKPAEFHIGGDGWSWEVGDEKELPTPPIRVRPVTRKPAEAADVEIQKGYWFEDYAEDNPDSGITIVYDKDSGRAYMWRDVF